MVSFELADGAAARAFVSRVRVATHAPSLGGAETLVCLPARTSHSGLTPEQRAARGISDGLVRMSVGLEDFDDLWADLSSALEPA
jgi:cystathionine beta-lyase/cystathionine gamma-synthase